MVLLDDPTLATIHAAHVAVLRGYAEAYRRVRPDAVDAPIGTGHALFAGEGSPLTQVNGFAHGAPDDPERLEAFFAGRAENWEVMVTPFTDPGTVRALLARGYVFGGFEGSLGQRVASLPAAEPNVREVGEGDPGWIEATSRGWLGDEEEAHAPFELARVAALVPGRRFLVEVNGVPAASASMMEFGDAVVLMGATTRIPFRGRGFQRALLLARLREAGVGRLALMGAVPGSSSHRNAQRAGFAPLFSTISLHRRAPVP